MRDSLKHITGTIGKGSVFVVFTLLMHSYANGQTLRSLDDDDELIANGTGERKIKPATKISSVPKLMIDSSKKQLKTDYIFYEYTAPSEFKLEPIKPAKIKILDPLDKLQKGYIKAGIGSYLSPLIDAHYGSERSRHNNWGINYNHFSSNTGIRDVGFSGLSKNHGDVFYKHFLDHMSVRGDLYYTRDVNYFYGFNTADTTIDKSLIRQRFQTIGGKAKVASYMQDVPEFNYNGEVGFRNYVDSTRARENNFDLNGRVQTIIDEELYGADASLNINAYRRKKTTPIDELNNPNFFQATQSNTNAIFKLAPHVITNRNKLKAKVGLDIVLDIGAITRFHFYPNAEFKYSFHDIFVPYVGINGNLKRNSFYSLSQENPFVLSHLTLQNSNTRYNIYGGVRGSVSKRITFNVQAAKSKVSGMPLYVNDTVYSIQNKFDVIYDTVDVFNLTGQLSYQAGEKLNIYGKAEYNLYSTLNQQYAWNMAPLQVTLGGIYDLADKIIIRADVFVVSARKALSLTQVDDADFQNGEYIVTLPTFVDFNLGVEYRYTKRFSAFVNFNNIISQKYKLYHRYPNQAINIMGGLTVKF